MKFSLAGLSRPIHRVGLLKLFLLALPLVVGVFLCFIKPNKLEASDFTLIAWNPGRELLTSGTVQADYPYPLWTVIALLPFALVPLQTAMLFWTICNILMLTASLAIFIALFDWEISPILFFLVVCLSVLFLPVLTSMWLGQLSIFSLLNLAMTTYFFLRQRWTRLGMILGLSFIKPQIMILLVGFILLWALWQRRWKVFLGFSVVIASLILISLPFISSPRQIIGGGIESHLSTYIKLTSNLWALLLSLGGSWWIPALISLLLLIGIASLWWPALHQKIIPAHQVLLTFSLTILVNLIVIPYSWMHNLVLLLLPFGFSLAVVLKKDKTQQITWAIILFILMQPLMLGLFGFLSGPQETQAYQIIPALALLPITYFLGSRPVPSTKNSPGMKT